MGRERQTSSAVKDRTGAMSFVRLTRISCMAVWAERRRGEAGAEV